MLKKRVCRRGYCVCSGAISNVFLSLMSVSLHQEDGGLGITFVEGDTEAGVEIESISEVQGHTGKVCHA